MFIKSSSSKSHTTPCRKAERNDDELKDGASVELRTVVRLRGKRKGSTGKQERDNFLEVCQWK